MWEARERERERERFRIAVTIFSLSKKIILRTVVQQLTTCSLQNNPERQEIDFPREYSYSLLFLETSREIIFFLSNNRANGTSRRCTDDRVFLT